MSIFLLLKKNKSPASKIHKNSLMGDNLTLAFLCLSETLRADFVFPF